MGKWFLLGLFGLLSLVLVAARIFPHDANFSPVLALCLVSGFLAKKHPALLGFPVVALLISDSLMGFYPGMAFTYLAFGALLLGGLRLPFKATGFAAGGLLGAVAFFVISNFGVWYASQLYSPDFTGLLTCYEMALAFFRASLLSTISYMMIFYGLFSLVGEKLKEDVLLEA